MILSFEMKYNNMMRGRLDAIELAVEDMAMEQARLNSNTSVKITAANLKTLNTTNSSVINSGNPGAILSEDSRYDALFPPNSVKNSIYEQKDMLATQNSIYDSCCKDR